MRGYGFAMPSVLHNVIDFDASEIPSGCHLFAARPLVLRFAEDDDDEKKDEDEDKSEHADDDAEKRDDEDEQDKDDSADDEEDDEKEEGKKFRPARIDVDLYTGAPVQKYGIRMVISLDGMEVPSRQIPILNAHDHGVPIGYATKTTKSPSLRMQGLVFDPSDDELPEDSRKAVMGIRAAARQGFHWQASMGISFQQVLRVNDGESMKVNGAQFEGPGFVVTKSTLLEGSVLALGADGDTRSTLLSLSSERGTVPVTSRESTMTKGDSLHVFLAAFPGRTGWAAELYASRTKDGGSFSVLEGKAELASVLERENAELRGKSSEDKKRLALLAKEGVTDDDATGFSGKDEDDGAMELGEYSILEFAGDKELRDDTNALLRPEFGALSRKHRKVFGDVDAFRALRTAEDRGRVQYVGFSK